MTVSEIARSEVVTTAPDTPVPEVAELMIDHDVGSVVVTENLRPAGVVTDRDIGVGVWDHDDPTAVTVADVMTPDPVTVEAGIGIYDALTELREANVRRLPVVDGGELVGIVTLDDFVVLLAGELEDVSDVIQAESPPY